MQLSMLPPALLALLPLASAGYSYGGGSGSGPTGGSPTSGAAAQTENGVTVIKVGSTPLKMEPNSVTVPAGEWIEFHFFTGQHSVAQSAFDSPCTPLQNGTTVGFFSGKQPVSSGEGNNVFRVQSTGNPMWYYCGTQQHCQNGMVGVINPPASGARTIGQYEAAAKNARANVEPAQVGGGQIADKSTGGTGTTTGTGPQASTSRPSAGVGMFGQLSMSMIGAAAVVAAIGGLVI